MHVFVVSTLISFTFPCTCSCTFLNSFTGFLNANVDRYSKAPANYGLMDIIAALHWIQENIEAFGGDPRAVTLAGYGTGAACVHYLMTSSAVPDGKCVCVIIITESRVYRKKTTKIYVYNLKSFPVSMHYFSFFPSFYPS